MHQGRGWKQCRLTGARRRKCTRDRGWTQGGLAGAGRLQAEGGAKVVHQGQGLEAGLALAGCRRRKGKGKGLEAGWDGLRWPAAGGGGGGGIRPAFFGGRVLIMTNLMICPSIFLYASPALSVY